MRLTFVTDRKLLHGKSRLSLTVDEASYEPTGRSRDDWSLMDYDLSWSLIYDIDDYTCYEFEFERDEFGHKTMTPTRGLIWKDGVIDSDFLFEVK